MNRPRVTAGGNVAVDAATVVLGFALAVALARVLVWNSGFGGPAFEVSPVPNTAEEWAFVGALVVPPAAAAVLGGSWLSWCWFPFPSFFVAFFHYFEAGSGTFVVGVGLPTVAGLALAAAFVVGTTGYLLGVVGRWGHSRIDGAVIPRLGT